jgi:hypothetical protein
MKPRLLALLLAASAAAFGADSDFDRLVKAVEARFGVHRTYIPMMGVANFFVKIARPEGARGFKLAVFEDLRSGSFRDGSELDRLMEQAAAGLRPLVRVRSRRDGEFTYIYTGDFGKNNRMLVASFERDEAAIVELKLDMEALARSLSNPRSMDQWGRGSGSGDRRASLR